MDSGSWTGNNGFWKWDWEQWILEVKLGTMDSGRGTRNDKHKAK